jgi:SAM-dependent methyltransferase
MFFRSFAKKILRHFGLELKRSHTVTNDRALRRYYESGQIPWSEGYDIAHDKLIATTLDDGALLDTFAAGGRLPHGYGIGIDERCVELPWVFANIRGVSGKILDGGSSLNYPFIVERILTEDRKLHVLTLSPEEYCFANRGVSYLYDDLRRIPIVDEFYDCVLCISTLEHVGFDNAFFTNRFADREHRPSDYLLACREMFRVLRPGGGLFITVPFGRYQDFGCFQQFSHKEVASIVEALNNASKANVRYFKVQGSGEWNVAGADECALCESVHWVMASPSERPKVFPLAADRAASARAVACISVLK